MILPRIKHFSFIIIIFFSEKEECLVLDIDPEIIQNHFDDCIKADQEERQNGKMIRNSMFSQKYHKYDYTVDFTSILPPRQTKTTEELPKYEKKENYLPEMAVFRDFKADSDYKHLLGHPLSLIFVAIKWHRVRKFFYMDIFLYVLFTLVLNAQILMPNNMLHTTLSVLFVIVFIWEVIQTVIFGAKYFKNLDNWLTFLLLVMSGITISMWYKRDDPKDEVYERIVRQINATTALVSILNFFFLIGHFPSISTSVIMVKTVYLTLFKSLMTYSILLLAFTSSFYVLFHPIPDPDNYSEYLYKGYKYNSSCYGPFDNYGLAIVKSVLMATGEYDSVNFPLQENPVYYPIMTLFVIVICVGLFNLLTALAVSDIQNIKTSSELWGQVIKIEQIARMERLFLTRRLIRLFPFLKYIALYPIDYLDTKVNIDVGKQIVEGIAPSKKPIPLNEEILEMLEARRKLFKEECLVTSEKMQKSEFFSDFQK